LCSATTAILPRHIGFFNTLSVEDYSHFREIFVQDF